MLLAFDAITPIPLHVDVNKQKAQLGKKLFMDPRLSRDNTVSCASCHDLYSGGDDGIPRAIGIDGKQGLLNSPTVYNAVFHFRQFWDGRAKDLHDQAKGPIANPIEMDMNLDALVSKLSKTSYKREFEKVYAQGLTKQTIIDAIATFEQALITPNSAFDRYLRGDKEALSASAKRGFELFVSKGCITCHHGVAIGGNMYNKFGVLDELNSKHLGRYNVTKREQDKYVFKVPSLRNIELTAPYLHDGSIDNLDDVIRLMAKYQLGRFFKPQQLQDIKAFLLSLTGELPAIVKEP